jgi:hypothetical protein
MLNQHKVYYLPMNLVNYIDVARPLRHLYNNLEYISISILFSGSATLDVQKIMLLNKKAI